MSRRLWALCVDASQHQDQCFPVRAGGRQGDAYAGLQMPDAHRDLQERALNGQLHLEFTIRIKCRQQLEIGSGQWHFVAFFLGTLLVETEMGRT